MANKGDTLTLYLDFTLEDGTTPLPSSLNEVELSLNKDGSKGALEFTKTGGTVTWDSTVGCYKVVLTQAQTFGLPQTVKYQVRILNGSEVQSSKIGAFNLGDVLSSEVLD